MNQVTPSWRLTPDSSLPEKLARATVNIAVEVGASSDNAVRHASPPSYRDSRSIPNVQNNDVAAVSANATLFCQRRRAAMWPVICAGAIEVTPSRCPSRAVSVSVLPTAVAPPVARTSVSGRTTSSVTVKLLVFDGTLRLSAAASTRPVSIRLARCGPGLRAAACPGAVACALRWCVRPGRVPGPVPGCGRTGPDPARPRWRPRPRP